MTNFVQTRFREIRLVNSQSVNPIQNGEFQTTTGCLAGILVHIVSRENTTYEVETIRFLEGAADY